MKKVLIIKMGYSETLDRNLSLTTSLGDVLRTTAILHFFKDDRVSWLADRRAVPLLEHNKYISRILILDKFTHKLLKKERFDTVVNLEKMPRICRLANSLEVKEFYGFGKRGSKELMKLSRFLKKRRENKDCWQKILAEALKRKWQGQPYVLGYKPKSKIKYDIGFNWTTSNRWTNKAWPKKYWYKLEDLIKGKYSIFWQQGFNNLYKYMDWINSCRLIVTADTLGAHLAMALKKKVVILFGPTSWREIYFYNLGSFLIPRLPYKCIPCFKPYCDKKRQCMEYISPLEVKERVEREFNK